MIKSIFKTVLLTLFLVGSFTGMAQKKFGGLALYTVRADMNKDVKATLQAVSDAGYKNIEAAGYKDGKYYGMEPAEFKSLLKEIGLKPISTHQASVNLDNADEEFAAAEAVGFKYFVIPVPIRGMYDRKAKGVGAENGADKLAEALSILGEKATKYGLKLLYHNHAFEFDKDDAGNTTMDYLLQNTDPKYVNFQLDLYWITKAKEDPIAYFEKYSGRFILWHVKDMDDDGKFAPVGRGNIDFAKILEYKKLSGMKYYYVEQDNCFDLAPLEAIKISHDALEGIGFK